MPPSTISAPTSSREPEPRRLKLVVSDFHVGTGARLPDGEVNILEDFLFDNRFLEFLDYHSRGEYEQAEVELVINGDFFNLLQVEIDGVIPHLISEQTGCRQMLRVIDGHPELLDGMREFARRPNKRITFLIGNHDAALLWPKVRQILKERLGNRNVQVHDKPYRFDGVHIEHGDLYEPVHSMDPRNLFVDEEVVVPYLNLPWGSYFFIHFVSRLKQKRAYVDKVKPFRTFLSWSILYDFRFYLVTMVQLVVFVLWTALFARIGRSRYGLVSLLMLLRQSEKNPEMRAAKRILRKGKARTVIFGHTHNALYRSWYPGREYFNTGCWNGFTNLDIEGLGYQVRLTYAFLEWREGRWITSLRMWKGVAAPYEEFWG